MASSRTLLALAAALFCGCGLGARTSSTLFPTLSEPEGLSAGLRPNDEVRVPDGSGPFPTVLLFPDCQGTSDGVRGWAASLQRRGWASVIVDSFTARGVLDPTEFDTVCSGDRVPTIERAADVLVSLSDLKSRAVVDPEHLAVVAWEHGASAALDALALVQRGRRPPGLSRFPEEGLPGLRGVALLDPHCGPGSQAHGRTWRSRVPLLLVLGPNVRDPCAELATRSDSLGLPTEAVLLQAPGGGPGFYSGRARATVEDWLTERFAVE